MDKKQIRTEVNAMRVFLMKGNHSKVLWDFDHINGDIIITLKRK